MLAGNGGTIALHSFQGLYLDGTLRGRRRLRRLGGALILTLQTPRYGVISSDPSVPDELRYFRELTIGQRAQPSGAADGLRAGRARISAEQIRRAASTASPPTRTSCASTAASTSRSGAR